MAEPVSTNHEFLGDWRIIEMDVWDSDALDLIGPACLSIESNGTGSLLFIAIRAGVDYRVEDRDGVPCLEFSWEGHSDGDPICGRAWAKLEGDEQDARTDPGCQSRGLREIVSTARSA